MSRKKIKPIDLQSTVDELLVTYGDEIFDVLGKAIKETSEEAKQELQGVNHFSPNGNPSGEYAKGWEYKQIQTTRLKTESVVYNEDHYRLTHLLESGHSKYLWGRATGQKVQGYPHIAPVNDRAQENVVKKVEEMIGKL